LAAILPASTSASAVLGAGRHHAVDETDAQGVLGRNHVAGGAACPIACLRATHLRDSATIGVEQNSPDV